MSMESFTTQFSAVAAIKPYAMLDTNQDEVVAPEELVSPHETPDEDTTPDKDIPTASAADTLTDPVISALLDVHTADDPAASVGEAVAAYHADDEGSLSA